MKVSGNWNAQFEFDVGSGFDYPPVSFSLSLEQTRLGQLRGMALYDAAVGSPREAEIHGSIRGQMLRFAHVPRGQYLIGPQGFHMTGELTQPARGVRFFGKASPYDIYFEGALSTAGDEARGTWRMLQWMMEGKSRKKIQVVTVWGDWWMRRSRP